ncbi:hypothetical protein K443DRAFT_475624 [Laccaria amethystina LaAM-08-1]|uniref:Uncharacterized protein n=1 Tax=Laccaria amethystina LaAM-08-1 TaxID=1095629 RepID=A0A0C9X552_9AGAR|nr:hypothetical protein K443DRAFT_475624 [Laccaria amethystina LaAM-08-1]
MEALMAKEVIRRNPRVHVLILSVHDLFPVTEKDEMNVSSLPPPSKYQRCDPGNKQSPAVALTVSGVHPCMALGTTRTASSKRTSKLRAAPSGLPAKEGKPGCVILNTSYSYSREGPQLLNL